MAAIVQKGTNVQIGFGGMTYSGVVLQDASEESTGDHDIVRDTDNAAHTRLISNLGKRISFTAVILSTPGITTPPAQSTVVSIDGASYIVVSSKIDYQAKESRLSLTLEKEDSITYS